MAEISQRIAGEHAPRLLPTILRRRKALWLGVLCGLLVGGIIAVTRPVTYSASSTLLFPTSPASRLSALAGDGGGGDLPSVPLLDGALMIPQPGTGASTAGLLLQSHRAAETIVRATQLQRHWKLPNETETIRRFQQKLQCKAGKSGELVIGFQDKSAPQAYNVVTTSVAVLQNLSQELGLNPAEANLTFLEKQAREADARSLDSQKRLLAFQQKNGMLSVPDEAKGLIEEYQQMKMDVTRAQLEASTSAQQVAIVATGAERMIRAAQDPMPSGDNRLAPLYQHVTQAQEELALLRERLTAEHPDVLQKQAELNEATAELNREMARQTALLKSGSSPVVRDAVAQASVNQAKASGLQQALSQMETRVSALPLQQAIYARLTTELAANTDAVKLFRQELSKARIIAERNGPMFVIADPAAMPLERDPLHRPVVLGLCMLLGLSFGLAMPYLEWFRLQQEYEEQRWARTREEQHESAAA